MVFRRTEALTAIADGLGAIKSSCEHRGLLHLFDNHTVAQHFFRRLLNAAYQLELVELDNLAENFPAIDLADANKRIAYQVTTEKASEKVTKTLSKFKQHKLDARFDTVKILIIGDRQQTYDAVRIPDKLKFSTTDDIIDVAGLLKHIKTLDTAQLEAIQEVLAEEVKSPLRFSLAATALGGLSIDIGVLREPPLHTDPGETFTDDRVLRYTLTKEKAEEEVSVILPQMGYLSQIGKSPIDAIPFFHNPFKCHYPCLDVTFVNNTGETLAITEAVFEVAESVPDILPVIVFKDDNARMQLIIDNEGWGKVCKPVMRCNIVPTGATDVLPDPPIGHVPVTGPYAHEIHLPDFEEITTLDLADTFTKLGVDVKTIKETHAVGQALAWRTRCRMGSMWLCGNTMAASRNWKRTRRGRRSPTGTPLSRVPSTTKTRRAPPTPCHSAFGYFSFRPNTTSPCRRATPTMRCSNQRAKNMLLSARLFIHSKMAKRIGFTFGSDVSDRRPTNSALNGD